MSNGDRALKVDEMDDCHLWERWSLCLTLLKYRSSLIIECKADDFFWNIKRDHSFVGSDTMGKLLSRGRMIGLDEEQCKAIFGDDWDATKESILSRKSIPYVM